MQAANILEIVICILLCTMGALFTYLKLRNYRKLLLPDCMLILSILFFAFGPLVSYLFGYGRLADSHWTVENISFGYFCISLFLISLLIGGKIFQPKSLFLPQFTSGGRDSPIFFLIRSLDKIKFSWILGAWMFLWLTRIIQLSYGGGISGFNSSEVMLSLPYPLVICLQFVQPLYITIVFYVVFQLCNPIRKNYFCLALLLPEFLYQALQGRRNLFYLVFYCGIVYFLTVKKFNWKLLILGPLSLVFIITVYSKVFLTFREVAQAERNSIHSEGLGDFLAQGVQGALEADSDSLNEKLQGNMVHRPRASNDWILTIVSDVGFMGALHGESTIHAMMSALPRALRPFKYWGDHASVIQGHLGLEGFDASDNYIANGYVDFGIFSLVIYGLALAAMMNFGLMVTLKLFRLEAFFSILIFAYLFQFSITIETSLVSVFVTIRNLIILILLGVILGSLGVNSGVRERKRIFQESFNLIKTFKR